jgi:hypothetical protein
VLAAGIGGPLLLLLALSWPLLFTGATFNEDWLNHLWYMWHESRALQATHLPSLFLDSTEGVFYPFYAFYGGTLYTLAGALSLALGGAPLQAYVLTYMLGFAAAYGGWYWLARMFGCRGWAAHVPGLVFVTAAPYLTMLYGLGDWPEFTAVSTMPLMIAAALSVLRTSRPRIWPALALAASSAIFFGSHLLTDVWGASLLGLLALALAGCVPEARRGVTRGALLRVLALMIPAALISAWFLLPAWAYESQTVIAHSYPQFRELLRHTTYVVAARRLLTLSRTPASGTIVTTALPVLAAAWTIGSVAILLGRGRRGARLRALLVIAAATVLLVLLMTHVGLILTLPRVYAILQFSFRLESYVLLGVSATLLLAIALIAREHDQAARRWRWLLVPVALVSLIGAIVQVDAHTSKLPRGAALASFAKPTFEREGLLDYVDDELPVLRRKLPLVTFPPVAAAGARAVARIGPHDGRRVDSNIRSSPDLVHLEGARIVGAGAGANDVLEVAPGSKRIAVSAAATAPVVLGRYISLGALLTLILELGAIAYRDRRSRPDARSGTRSQARRRPQSR